MREEIEERLSSLQAEIQSYSSQIIQHLSVLYTPIEGEIDLKNDPRNIIKILKSDVIDLMKELQDRTEYHQKYSKEIMECKVYTEYLEKISTASYSLKKCEEFVLGNDILAACTAITEMENVMSALPTNNALVNSGLVYAMLKREAKVLRSRFTSRLRRLLQDFIQISRGKIVVHRSHSGILRSENTLLTSELQLQDIWTALVLISGTNLEEIVSNILQEVWNCLIYPLWREKKQLNPRINSSGNPSEFILEFTTSSESTIAQSTDPDNDLSHLTCRMKFPHLLEHIEQIFGFLYKQLFQANDDIILLVSNMFQRSLDSTSASQISSPLGHNLVVTLRDTLLALIPKLDSEVELYQSSIVQACADFEKNMILYGFFAEPSSSDSKQISTLLSKTVGDIPSKFLEARRIEILSKARSLVLCDYHNTMLGTGDAQEDEPSSAGTIGDPRAMLEQSGSTYSLSSLPFESCQISLASCRLLKLIHEVMKQACSTKSEVYSTMLYQSARDCLEIFAAVVQSKFSDIIETVPRMGAVFYNDCCYISHNATLLTHLYRQDKTDSSFGFVDFIPRFRAIGERVLQGHVEEQKNTLLNLLSRVNITIPDDDSEPPAEETSNDLNNEEAAGILVKHMGKLKTQWQTVLQESVYNRLAGFLLEVVLRTAMRPVLEAKFISENTATDISRVFKAIQRSRDAFLSDSLDDENLLTMTGSWNKFKALTELLECSLTDIAEWLPKKKFVSFTGAELSSLVKALFEESSRRQVILSSILELSS